MANANTQTSQPLFSFGGMPTQHLAIKLHNDNFLLWQNMLLPILRGHKLEGFLNGETPSPSKFLVSTTTSSTSVVAGIPTQTRKELNPEYEVWILKDQLLLDWLYNSIQP